MKYLPANYTLDLLGGGATQSETTNVVGGKKGKLSERMFFYDA